MRSPPRISRATLFKMIAEFIAEIKELRCKTDADACLTGRIILEFVPTDETFLTLKRLYQNETNVNVAIMGEDHAEETE